MSSCGNCTTPISSGSSVIQCDGCQTHLHSNCVGLSDGDIKMTRAKSRSIKVVCNICNINMAQFKDIKLMLNSIKNDFSVALGELKCEFNDKLDTFKQEFNAKLNTYKPESTNFDDIVEEVEERQSKKRNILIFGMVEPAEGIAVEARIASETVELSAILKSIVPTLEIAEVLPHRIGRFNGSRCRPVKVTLKSESDVRSVLQNAHKLKTSSDYSHISISSDKTFRQRKIYKELEKELNTRKAQGEDNIKIKYIHGNPKIVHLN